MATGPGDLAVFPSGGKAAARPSGGPGWVLLPAVWCAWLLVWLIPSLLVAPHLAIQRPWLTEDTAPVALLAAAALFLTVIWPFWPALADAARSPAGAVDIRWFGLTLLEAVILIALAAPFALVAWSVGGREMNVGPLVAAGAGLGVLGFLLRTAAAGLGPGAGRWVMLAAMLLAAGPLLLAYAGSETIGFDFRPMLPASPVVGAVRLALGGWHDPTWVKSVAAVLVVVGACHVLGLLRRRLQASRA